MSSSVVRPRTSRNSTKAAIAAAQAATARDSGANANDGTVVPSGTLDHSNAGEDSSSTKQPALETADGQQKESREPADKHQPATEPLPPEETGRDDGPREDEVVPPQHIAPPNKTAPPAQTGGDDRPRDDGATDTGVVTESALKRKNNKGKAKAAAQTTTTLSETAATGPSKRKGSVAPDELDNPQKKRAKSAVSNEAFKDASEDASDAFSFESEEENPPVQGQSGRGSERGRVRGRGRGRRATSNAGPGRASAGRVKTLGDGAAGDSGFHTVRRFATGVGRGAGRPDEVLDAMDVDVELVTIPPAPAGEMTEQEKAKRTSSLMHLSGVVRARIASADALKGKNLQRERLEEQLGQLQGELIALLGLTPESLARMNAGQEKTSHLPPPSPPPPLGDSNGLYEDAEDDVGPAAPSSSARMPGGSFAPGARSSIAHPSLKVARNVHWADPLTDAARVKRPIKSKPTISDSGSDEDAPVPAPSASSSGKKSAPAGNGKRLADEPLVPAPSTSSSGKTSARAGNGKGKRLADEPRVPAPSSSSSSGKKSARASQGKDSDEPIDETTLPSDVDSSEAEQLDRERNPRKPGRLNAEQTEAVDEKARELEEWVLKMSEEWGKTPKMLYDMLGLLLKLGRGANTWNLYEAQWAATVPKLDGESTKGYIDRCRQEYKRLTKDMTKAEKRAFHAKLEEWRDEYRLLCAQDIIASGDRFKVERQLITQLQDVTRRFWIHYKIAVFGWLVCTDGADLSAQAAGGVFANTEFAKAFMNEKALAIEQLKQEMISLINAREKADALLNDHSENGAKKIIQGGYQMQGMGRTALTGGLKVFFSAFYQTVGLPPLPKMKWSLDPLAKTLLDHGYRVADWPDATPRIDEAEEARLQKPAQDKLLPPVYQWLREHQEAQPHTGLRIEKIPKELRDLKESNPTQFRDVGLWLTVGKTKLLTVGSVMDNKYSPTGYVIPKTARAKGKAKEEPKDEKEDSHAGAQIYEPADDSSEDEDGARAQTSRPASKTATEPARATARKPARKPASKPASKTATAGTSSRDRGQATEPTPRSRKATHWSDVDDEDGEVEDEDAEFDKTFARGSRRQFGGGDGAKRVQRDDEDVREIHAKIDFTHMGTKARFYEADWMDVEPGVTSSMAGALGPAPGPPQNVQNVQNVPRVDAPPTTAPAAGEHQPRFNAHEPQHVPRVDVPPTTTPAAGEHQPRFNVHEPQHVPRVDVPPTTTGEQRSRFSVHEPQHVPRVDVPPTTTPTAGEQRSRFSAHGSGGVPRVDAPPTTEQTVPLRDAPPAAAATEHAAIQPLDAAAYAAQMPLSQFEFASAMLPFVNNNTYGLNNGAGMMTFGGTGMGYGAGGMGYGAMNMGYGAGGMGYGMGYGAGGMGYGAMNMGYGAGGMGYGVPFAGGAYGSNSSIYAAPGDPAPYAPIGLASTGTGDNAAPNQTSMDTSDTGEGASQASPALGSMPPQ